MTRKSSLGLEDPTEYQDDNDLSGIQTMYKLMTLRSCSR